MSTTRYQVTVNGRITKRTSTAGREYTHAVVTRIDGAKARDKAYNYPSAVERRHDEGEFNNYAQYTVTGFPTFYTEANIADLRALVAAGLDAYIAGRRDLAITRFEKAVKNGCYLWTVHGFCGTEKLAYRSAATLVTAKKDRFDKKRRLIPSTYAEAKVIPVNTEVTLSGDYSATDSAV